MAVNKVMLGAGFLGLAAISGLVIGNNVMGDDTESSEAAEGIGGKGSAKMLGLNGDGTDLSSEQPSYANGEDQVVSTGLIGGGNISYTVSQDPSGKLVVKVNGNTEIVTADQIAMAERATRAALREAQAQLGQSDGAIIDAQGLDELSRELDRELGRANRDLERAIRDLEAAQGIESAQNTQNVTGNATVTVTVNGKVVSHDSVDLGGGSGGIGDLQTESGQSRQGRKGQQATGGW